MSTATLEAPLLETEEAPPAQPAAPAVWMPRQTNPHRLAYAVVNFQLAGHVSVGVLRDILSGILYGQGREIWVYYVPTSLSVALLMAILVRRERLLRLCRLPGLQAIGRISYGGYLFHVPVLMILGSLVPAFDGPVAGPSTYLIHIVQFVCAFLATVAVAWLSYQYLEQPFHRIGQRKAA